MTTIDILTTATLRPYLLDQTYDSFRKHMLLDKYKYRVFLNVDPVGDKYKVKDIVKVAKKYFDDVIFHSPKKPSFSKAVMWCWKQSSADYVFHLEDDWKCNVDINLEEMIKLLDKYEKLSSLRLCKNDIPQRPIYMFRCEYIPIEYNLLIASDSKKQFGLNPILIKGEFVQQSVPRMSTTLNPEKQFRYSNLKMRDHIMNWKYGIFGNPGDHAFVTDIGRDWRQMHGFKKPLNETFLNWIQF